jgi:hypothetical protein
METFRKLKKLLKLFSALNEFLLIFTFWFEILKFKIQNYFFKFSKNFHSSDSALQLNLNSIFFTFVVVRRALKKSAHTMLIDTSKESSIAAEI